MEQQRSSVMVDVGEHGLKKHDIKTSTVVFMIFCVATSAIVIPMIVYQIMNKMGKVGHIVTLHGDEKTFEETFPPINQVKDAE